MILTGPEIVAARDRGDIVIDPFVAEHVNPNSYNFRLGPRLRRYVSDELDPREPNEVEEITIPPEGFVLEPGKLYLAHTVERLGGVRFAPTFTARSSVARLGLFINLSAELGDIGFVGQWTLQLYATHPLRVYSGMEIGQMIWWRPVGDIDLYEGKYQGAVGPRSSDIHKDFLKTEARSQLPSPGSTIDGRVGGKFSALARHASSHPVPDAFAIPVEFLDTMLTQPARGEITDVLQGIRATVGAFLLEDVAVLHKRVAHCRLPERSRDLLSWRVTRLLAEHPGARLAVRSSALDEDGHDSSRAGVYRSILGLEGPEAVIAAVEEAWRAGFDVASIAARVRAGDYSLPELALFVQVMVEPAHAGVAFTAGDDVELSWVDGLADGLVSGAEDGSSWRSGDPLSSRPAALAGVENMARDLRADRGEDVDVEWAVDAAGVAWLLQVRPVTARGANSVQGAHLSVTDLYGDEEVAGDWGDVAGIRAMYVTKRSPAHRLARSLGATSGAGVVVEYNAAGLADNADALLAFLATVRTPQVVADFNPNTRQVMLPRSEVLRTLRAHASALRPGQVTHVILREFVQGEAGAITMAVEEGVLVEVAPEGLMALNRGTAVVGHLTLADNAIVDVSGVLPELVEAVASHAAALTSVTRALRDELGALTVEWALEGGEVFCIDYSRGESAVPVTGRVMAPGAGLGDVLDLREHDGELRRLSVGPAVSIDKSIDVSDHGVIAATLAQLDAFGSPPIIVATHPYAVLSTLIGRVAGFVFEHGSALCHLAILLREAGVPAAVAEAPVGDRLLIADGQVAQA